MGYNHRLHGLIQFHPYLSACLPPLLARESGGEALELELASHRISLHLLHFLSVLVLHPSPPSCALLSSFFHCDLLLSSCHYHCIGGGRWTQQFSLLILRGVFLLKRKDFVTVTQCALMVMKAIVIQLGLSGVWRRFFWKLGEGESWLAALSANQRQETRREREGAGESERESWRTGGGKGGRAGRVSDEQNGVCVCECV